MSRRGQFHNGLQFEPNVNSNFFFRPNINGSLEFRFYTNTTSTTYTLPFTLEFTYQIYRYNGTIENVVSLTFAQGSSGYAVPSDLNKDRVLYTISGLNANDIIYIKGNNPNKLGQHNQFFHFSANTSGTTFTVGGKLLDLMYNGSDNTALPSNTERVMNYLFYRFETLTDASQLNINATSCYKRAFESLFRFCTGLVHPPKEIPLQLIRNTDAACYEMFYGCASLIESPILYSTTISAWGYGNMFYNCSSLCKVTVYFTSWPTNSGTGMWLYGVNNNGTFYSYSTLPDSRGDSYIPNNWQRAYLDR